MGRYNREVATRAQKIYDAANTMHVAIKLNRKTDADIVARLEQEPNKQGFIKQCIREYIEKAP